MKKSKKILFLSLLLLGSTLCFSLSASAQLTLLSSSPAATETPAGAHYYIINDPIAHGAVALSWNFSKGLDGNFTSNISSIKVKEKGSSTEIGFDTSAGTQTSPAPGYESDTGSLLIQNADFTYLKAGKNPDPELRELSLNPTTVTFQAGKTYVVTIDNATFKANNGNILDFKYAFEFRTETPPSTSSTTTTAAAGTSTTTTAAAGTSTTTSVDNATSTTTTINSTCIFVQAMGRKQKC